MRLNWFSPLPPAETDIAHYTERLLPYLARHVELTLWSAQSTWEPAVAAYAPVRRYTADNLPWSEINQADLTVYHVGNDARFHVPIWNVSRRHPGLVVLHDPCMQDFFFGAYRGAGDKHGYLTQMESCYGETGRRMADDLWDGRCSVYDVVERYPLTGLAAAGALAVLVHSRAAFDTLRRDPWRALVFAPLPYPATPRARPLVGDSAAAPTGPPYHLVVFGYLDRNRGLEALLLALAQFPDRDRFRLDVYGPLWDTLYVRDRIGALGLDAQVVLHGYLSPPALERALATADLAINLRSPSMGESSGSQLRIWDHALPSLVSRTGWYATIPEDAVAFVRPGHEVADLHLHLRGFLADPQRFKAMGACGRRILEERHDPAAYVRAIVNAAEKAERFGRSYSGYGLAERAAAEMGPWLSPTAPAQPYARVAAAVRDLAVDDERER